MNFYIMFAIVELWDLKIFVRRSDVRVDYIGDTPEQTSVSLDNSEIFAMYDVYSEFII